MCYDGYAAVPKLGKTCLILEDNFERLNLDNWQREVRLDGYDNGEFQWTTNSDNNSFVEDGILYLTPTLTSDHLGEEAISNGYTLNLTQDGTCTSENVTQCVAVSNTSRLTVINPVMSARLITKNTHSIKYGKVEVRAKFPTGDWLWPSIFMLPVEEKYGKWPRSGEIDIVTGRGNNASYPTRGVDFAQSALHWGESDSLCCYHCVSSDLRAVQSKHEPLSNPTPRPHIRLGPTVDDVGIPRAAPNILQPAMAHVRDGVERRVSLDLHRLARRTGHFASVQRQFLDKGQIPEHNHQHDDGRDSAIDQSLDRK